MLIFITIIFSDLAGLPIFPSLTPRSLMSSPTTNSTLMNIAGGGLSGQLLIHSLCPCSSSGSIGRTLCSNLVGDTLGTGTRSPQIVSVHWMTRCMNTHLSPTSPRVGFTRSAAGNLSIQTVMPHRGIFRCCRSVSPASRLVLRQGWMSRSVCRCCPRNSPVPGQSLCLPNCALTSSIAAEAHRLNQPRT